MSYRHDGGANHCCDSLPDQGLLIDGSDCSTRSSSDRIYNEDDQRIVERLQFLTQRVEELEFKLESSLSSGGEDLSFGFSIDDSSPVPKIDVKVLTGPKSPRYPQEDCSPPRRASRLQGWDEATVERNSSFVIIPSVGKDKDPRLSRLQKKRQTLTLHYSSSPLPCHDNDNQNVNDAGISESKSIDCYNARSPAHFSPESALPVSERELMAIEGSIDSEDPTTTYDSESASSDESLSSQGSIAEQYSISCAKNEYSTRLRDYQDKAVGQIISGMSTLNTGTPATTSANSPPLRYGYTISVAGISASYGNDKPKSERRVGEDISLINYEEDNDGAGSLGARQSTNVLTSLSTHQNCGPRTTRHIMRNYPVAKDYADPRVTEQLSHGNMEYLNGEEQFHIMECDNFFADRPIRTDLQLSKHDQINHNSVDSSSPNSYSIDRHYAQLRHGNTENNASDLTTTRINPEMGRLGQIYWESVLVERKGGEINTRTESDNHDSHSSERIDMQMRVEGLQKARADYSVDETSHSALRPRDNSYVNTQDYRGLPVNNSARTTTSGRDGNERQDWTLEPRSELSAKEPVTPISRREWRRSGEFARTSRDQDDELYRAQDAAYSTYSDPRHDRRQRIHHNEAVHADNFTRAAGGHIEHSNGSFQDQLRGLIDPAHIGNVQEELASRPRVLLADVIPISPTESGFVEGSSIASTYDSVFESEKGTPVQQTMPELSRNSSPYSSFTSISSINDRVFASKEDISTRISRDNQMKPHFERDTANNNSTSHEPSNVLYIGTEFTEPDDKRLQLPSFRRTSEHRRLDDFFSSGSRQQLASPTSSVTTSDFSDPFLECQCECQCECQTGIPTKEDFREELKFISRYILKERARAPPRAVNKLTRKYYLDEEQGEMDIFGAKLQRGEHKVVPMLVKVILRLRKHFFGGIEGPSSLKSLSPREKSNNTTSTKEPKRKISFSPSAMLLSAVGESSAAEIRDVIEKDRLDVNQLSPSGKSLLHKAASAGDLESIHTLIQYGANVNITDQDDFSPINSALRKSHYKCAIFLVECGTDVGAYTKARIRELTDIKNLTEHHLTDILNTTL